MSQSADTNYANAGEDVDVVLESLCFSCPPTIVDEQCKVNVIVGVLTRKNEELCSLSLVDTVILEQCANDLPQFEMKSCFFLAGTSEIPRNLMCIIFGCFKTKKIVWIPVISVMSNIFKC
jgi:hypothetical protein